MEIDENRVQQRVLEVFTDGKIAFATIEKEFNTFLAKEPYPELSEINSTEDFIAQNISKSEFEKLWLQNVK